MTLSTLSVSGLATSLSGVGAIVGIPISPVAAFIGLVAVGFSIVGKKFSKTISKHEKKNRLLKQKIEL